MIIRKQINTRMSGIVEHNNTIYFAGIVANDLTLDMKGQALDALKIAEETFKEAGITKHNLLRAEIFVKNISRDFADFNLIWDEWVSKENPPARACVEANMASDDFLVEIIFTAAKE